MKSAAWRMFKALLPLLFFLLLPWLPVASSNGASSGAAVAEAVPATSLPNADPLSLFAGDDDNQYLVLHIGRLGLANRLRTIADWYAVARRCKRVLLVAWTVTNDCNIAFSELFEAVPRGLKVTSLTTMETPESIEQAISTMNRTTITALLDKNSALWAYPGKFMFMLSDSFLQLREQVVVVNYTGVVSVEGTPCQLYLAQRSAFYRSLMPVAKARQFVDDLMDAYFGSYLPVAVHVRAHDPNFDWAVVPPHSGGKAVEFGDGAPLELFAHYMQLIQRHMHDPVRNQSLVRFLVVSNEPSAKQALLNRFGLSVVTMAGDLRRSHRDGMYFAFIEWLAVSRCELVLNVMGSSFAEEAAQVHGKDLVSLWANRAIVVNQPSLPFCSHLLYLFCYGQSVSELEYVEGTHDSRTIKSKAFSGVPSAILQHWGLPKVFRPSSE